MALVELEPVAPGRAGQRSKRDASPTSPGAGGGGESTPAAQSGVRRLLARPGVRVWAPLALRGLAVLAGMLALAAIGASSIARGSGAAVPLPSAHSAGSFIAGGVAALGGAAQGQKAAASASAQPRPSATPSSAPAPSSSAPTPDAGSSLTADGKVILNRAGPDDLTRLPGVGRKRAEAIVALRQKLGGRFKRLTDLLRVKGIGTKGLKKMEPHLVLDAPS
jgi:competence protein ComEA